MSIELDEVRGFLAAHEPFSHLPDADLDALPARMTMRYIRRGTTIVAAGDPNDTLHVIRTGAVDVLSADGTLVDRRDAGATFAYSTLVGERDSHYTMVAVEDSLILELPRDAFDALCAAHPDVARFFDALTRRTLATVRALEDDSADTLRTRLSDIDLPRPITAQPTASIRDIATLMEAHRVSSMLLVDGEQLVGIVTDRDLRGRVVAEGVDITGAVENIMTRDPVTVRSDALAMEALLHMAERHVHHLPVVDEGRLVSVVTQSDITRLLHDDPVFLAADVSRSTDLAGAYGRAADIAVRFIERGARPDEVCAIMTMVADAIARRLCELAEAELGAPPVPYAFVAVGSQGRREMGLASDQDNALVLDDSFDPDAHGDYFARLGSFVCEGLDRAGQVLCPGDMMASNPSWRMTVSQWESTFHSWVTAPQPDALLHAQVFFDFRALYGDAALAERVHASAVLMAQGSRRLHAHLASLAARREPPLTFFRGFVVERDGDYASTLDVKKGGTAGIVQMARLYALASGSRAVETTERLRSAAGTGVSEAGARELADAFFFLRQLTFQHQAARVRAGHTPDYHIDPKALGRLDREHLRDAFRIIKGMQNSLATTYPVRSI